MSNRPSSSYPRLSSFDEATRAVIAADIAKMRNRSIYNSMEIESEIEVQRMPPLADTYRAPQQPRNQEESRKRTLTAEQEQTIARLRKTRRISQDESTNANPAGPSTTSAAPEDVEMVSPSPSSTAPPRPSAQHQPIPEDQEDPIESARSYEAPEVIEMEAPRMKNQKSMQEVLFQAAAHARKEEHFKQGGFEFISLAGHILESSCKHFDGVQCLRCKFDTELQLPELPEMVFPRNTLTIRFPGTASSYIEFNCLDALKLVSLELPDVKVGASDVWRSARRDRLLQITEQHKPFDWTYTTHYRGTVHECNVVPTTERIDMERLKRRDQIMFCSSVTLFEDELADHGIAQLSARVRVMDAGYFFVLLRFYMRVDNVLLRVADTRIVGNDNENFVIREWQLREAKYEDVGHVDPELLLDVDRAWMYLPVIDERYERISAL